MTEFRIDTHKTYNGRYMYLSCTQEQDVQKNTSIIHWTLTVTGGTSTYYTTGPTTVKIGGQTAYYCDIVYWNNPRFPASKGSVSGTVEIPHQTDGTKTIECAVETAIYDGVLRTAKGSWDLDPIPRASTVMATDCFIGGTCVVLVDRKSSQYTHTIGFCAPNLEGFLCADGSLSQEPVQLSAASIPFQVPLTMYDRIPKERQIECRLVCTTYAGQTQIGEVQECTFRAACREEDCVPFLHAEVTDCNEKTLALTGDENVLVRFFSRARCRIEAEARKGASITHKQVGAAEITGSEVEIPNVETGAFLFGAMDSRGFQNTQQVEKTLLPYKKLTANYVTHRESPTSDKVTLTVTGDWWEDDFGKEENALTITCLVGEREIAIPYSGLGESAYTASATIEGLAYDKTSNFTLIVEDKLIRHEMRVTVKPGIPVFDWGEKDFAFHVPVTLSDGAPAVSQEMLLDAVFPVDSIVVRYDRTSPAKLFGGTWEPIVNPETGEGVFLLSCGEGVNAGMFGGEGEVTLTEKQIPSHKHGFLDFWMIGAGAKGAAVAVDGDGAGLENKENDRSYTANTGGGAAHNNMPPYVTVFIWRRIA